jgi:hypothetical protein
MGLFSNRQGRLVGAVLMATLGVALLVVYRPNPGSVGDEAAAWWPAFAGPTAAFSACKDHQAQSALMPEDALVPFSDDRRFVGPETRFLRGVAGYCEAVSGTPATLPAPG